MLPLCGQIEISRRKSDSGDGLVCRRLNSTSRHSFEVYEKRKWGRARSQCFIASTPTQIWLNPDIAIKVCVFAELRRQRFAKLDQEYALLQIFWWYPIFFAFIFVVVSLAVFETRFAALDLYLLIQRLVIHSPTQRVSGFWCDSSVNIKC